MSLMDVFTNLLSAEDMEDSLSSYKEKLNTLERIEYSRIARLFTGFEFLSTAPLKVMLSSDWSILIILCSDWLVLTGTAVHQLHSPVDPR